MFNSGCPFTAGGLVKPLDDHFIPPHRSVDVVHNTIGDFLGHHAENTDLPHWKTYAHVVTNNISV